MSATARPPLAKSTGNNPHATPSLRLLTKPAWLHADRLRSAKLVSTNTRLNDRGGTIGPGCARASLRAKAVVSCTNKADSNRPHVAIETPERKSALRKPYVLATSAHAHVASAT